MVSRTRLGLIYSYDENWIGGTYYILNLIKALNHLTDAEKPTIVLFTENRTTVADVQSETGYPYFDYIKYPIKLNLLKRGVNKFGSLIGLRLFSNNIYNPNVDLIYPKFDSNIKSNLLKNIFWIPDFQEEFLPALFTEQQISNRRRIRKKIAQTADFLVFSSEDSRKHFNDFYPNYRAEQFTLNFAVSHPNLKEVDSQSILNEYGLNKPYFYVPNQFWVHKNHITVLKALVQIKKYNKNVLVVFSGKEYDHRAQDHVDNLKQFVIDNELSENVKFLGFLPRDHQLVILRESVAIIQPSLFEGWSTVVEDAKAQNKFLFLSDLDVHKEQVKNNVVFFDKLNHEDLAQKIIETTINIEPCDYTENIVKFGKDFYGFMQRAKAK